MANNSSEKLGFLYDEETAKPKSEDYLLGKAIDKDFERGTLGQINAVEYGKTYLFFDVFSFPKHTMTSQKKMPQPF